MSDVTCGEAVVEVLERARVEVVFGVLSVHNLPIYEAIARRGRIRCIASLRDWHKINVSLLGDYPLAYCRRRRGLRLMF